ncbi:MAG: hypothetical protein WEA58_10780 [Balneolaceae bacterium]
MKETKILEIGAEGGHLIFYKISESSETYYTSARSEKFKTAKELFENYSKTEDPLLWFYPMEISEEIRNELLPVLLDEYKSFGADYFMNLYAWEEKLNVKFSELKPDGHQTFLITPVIKHERYEYDSYGENPQFIDSVITTYRDNPKYRKKLTGIGSVEGNIFVIRDENSVIKGVFPLDRYDVAIKTRK